MLWRKIKFVAIAGARTSTGLRIVGVLERLFEGAGDHVDERGLSRFFEWGVLGRSFTVDASPLHVICPALRREGRWRYVVRSEVAA